MRWLLGYQGSGRSSASSGSGSSWGKRDFARVPDGLEIVSYVGSGSFGKVYYCAWGDQHVAAKVMSWTTQQIRKFDPLREAKLCLELLGPGVGHFFLFFWGLGFP